VVKVVYNSCFGGFGLSKKAMERYKELGGAADYDMDINRSDPILVQVVEEMTDPITKESNASGSFGDLEIRDVPKGERYFIDEYDGNERVVLESEFQWEVA
jgi:hypothetical protein